MPQGNSKYLQIAAYVMLAAIFVFIISIAKDCSRLPYVAKEGQSDGDTLDIALIYGPQSYYLYADSLDGINRRVAEAFEKHSGMPVKLWPITEPADGLLRLGNGYFDILASLPLDNTIKERFPVSESIFLDRLVLVQLADSITGKTIINSSLDLDGKKICVPMGSSAINRLKNLTEEIGGHIEIEEIPEMSDELLCLQVASGETPLAVVNESVAKTLAKTYPNLSYDSSISFTQFQVWVFNPADTIVYEKFNTWFDTFKSSETFKNILDSF